MRYLIYHSCPSSVPQDQQVNVDGKKLELCSDDPVTGWNRTGYAYTAENDPGTHVICATMTKKVRYLQFTTAIIAEIP